jgi:hypothetical protein
VAHFCCKSWACIENRFREGGPYAGNSGWYDILRAAQDGDRITATLPDYQTSISGSFVRTREGRILIDMGYSHLAPEAEFARFSGRWADAASHGWPSEYGRTRTSHRSLDRRRNCCSDSTSSRPRFLSITSMFPTAAVASSPGGAAV